MTKEEKIKYLTEKISELKSFIALEKDKHFIINEQYRNKVLEEVPFQIEMCERELKLLQIPQRTIETLQVGDYIIYDTQHMEDNRRTVMSEIEIEGYQNGVKKEIIEKYEIIPHEYLEMWKLWGERE